MELIIVIAIAIVIFLLWKNSQILMDVAQEQSNADKQVYVYDSYPYYDNYAYYSYPYAGWGWGGYPYAWRGGWRGHGGGWRGRRR